MPIQNPEEFVGGAGLGTGFGLLTSGIQELISKVAMFERLLKSVQSTLITLDSDQQLSNPGKELEGLAEVKKMGEKLVSDCKEVSEWNPFTKYYYSNKLLAWNDSLNDQLRILPLHLLTDGKKTASTVEKTASTVEKTASTVEKTASTVEKTASTVEKTASAVESVLNHLTQNKASASSSFTTLQPPELPQDIYIVGLDTPLMDLKKKLLEDDGPSVLVLTAPGGCGKTTLATMFCDDEQVKGMVCIHVNLMINRFR